MNDKKQILAALREELDLWEALLAHLDEDLITAPRLAGDRSIKDVVAHLRAWQLRSVARLEAGLHNRDPQFPAWPAGLDPESEDVDQINAWIYETHRGQPWSSVHGDWRAGFLRFLELAEAIPEPDLLQAGRYPWLGDYPLSYVLTASLEHHQRDHREPLLGWLWQHGHLMIAPSRQAGRTANRSMPPGVIIPELVYGDLDAAVAWLCQTFELKERLRIGNHRSQLVYEGASVIAVADSNPAAPLGEQTHSLMVRVLDVDGHYDRVKRLGAHIVHPPETYPYGERQYTVQDPGGHRWTFSQSVADIAPEEWGGKMGG